MRLISVDKWHNRLRGEVFQCPTRLLSIHEFEQPIESTHIVEVLQLQ